MKATTLPIPFPFGGLVVNRAFQDQPPGTTPQAVNVRGYDPTLGRDRGGQRSGLSKYCALPIIVGTQVQDINSLVTTLATPAGAASGQFFYYPTGSGSTAGTGLADKAGTSITSLFAKPIALQCSCWDALGFGYVACGDISTGTIHLIKTNTTGTQIWNTSPIPNTANAQCVGLASDGTFLYVHVYSTAANYRLPVWKINAATGALVGITFWYKSADTTILTSDLLTANNTLAIAGPHLAIGYGQVTDLSSTDNAYGELINTTTLNRDGSFEYNNSGAYQIIDVCTDGYGTFYFLGRRTTGTPDGFIARLNGASSLISQNSALATANSICFDPVGVRLAVCFSATGGPSNNSLATYDLNTLALVTSQKPGALFWNTVRPDGAGGFLLWRNNASNNLVRVGSDLVTAVWGPTSASNATSVKAVISTNSVPMVPVTSSLGQLRPLAVVGGLVYRFNATTPIAPNIVSNAMNPGVPVIFSAQLQSRMYYSDGFTYIVYDAATDSVAALVASAGSLPVDSHGYTGRLLCTWRQRLVISGLPFDSSNWFMSAVGDPTNWNYAPSPTLETQAVAGNTSTAGLSPDIVNCLIAYSDEILIIGGDHTIYQMTGDPMSGGRIDLVTDQVGIAYGNPWCRDGMGVLYFMSSRGSIYQFAPGAEPQRMSDAISELLTGTVNLGVAIVRMAWDERQLGFHVFITPTGGAAAATHYFWDQRNQAWWQDVFVNNNHNPLAVHELQGFTAADRVILLGGQDGYIRFLDQNAADDDGTDIASNVFIGPIKTKNADGYTLADVEVVLDTNSGPAILTVYAASNAQQALAPAAASFITTLAAGRNRSLPMRVFGHALYVRLSSRALPGEKWALESLTGRLRLSEGKGRQRQFTA